MNLSASLSYRANVIFAALVLGGLSVPILSIAIESLQKGSVTLNGRFLFKLYVVSLAEEPVIFISAISIIAGCGVLLLCIAITLFYKAISTANMHALNLSHSNPVLFGKTRPFIFWLGVVLIVPILVAVLMTKFGF